MSPSNGATSFQPSPGAPPEVAPAWRAYVHLYLPVLTSALLVLLNPFEQYLLLLASAIPTHISASLIYHPRPAPLVRFTRKSDFHRAAVLFTYGRLFGTPFNLSFYICDLVANYLISPLLGERDAGEPQRWSEFFVHLLLTLVSNTLFSQLSPDWGVLWSIAAALDRTMFRATYLALVDDLVRVLAYPDLRTKRGALVVFGVQAAFIFFSVMWVHCFFVMKLRRDINARELGV